MSIVANFSFDEDAQGNPCISWINPWSGKRETVAMFFWPEHPPEMTEEIEQLWEAIGKGCAVAAKKSIAKEPA